jgi:hypothetical protein
MSPATLLNPKVALLVGAAAALATPRVRRAVGRGLGYGAAGTRRISGAVAHTGQDIYSSARETAVPGGAAQKTTRKRAAATA